MRPGGDDELTGDVKHVKHHLDLDTFLEPRWLREVATTRDTELRCHRIALTYSKYAAFLDTWLNGRKCYWHGQLTGKPADETNANWFHFSTWAALTVSRNIGSIGAPQRFDGWPNVVRQTVAPYVVRARGTNHQAVGQALATAQLKIFVNTCLAFIDFRHGTKVNPDGLKPDPKTRDAARFAFDFYQWAKDNKDDLRERYILLANILSTVVEQHLIDDQLAAVIEAVPNRLTEVTEGRLGQLMERLLGVQRQVTEFTVANRLGPARVAATTLWGRLLTDQVFVMSLPGEMLRVGRDVPPLQRNEPYYPRSLRRPAEFVGEGLEGEHMALLRSLIVRFDRTVGDGRGSAARDWRRYDERMNWAITLLRSRQQDKTMFWPPYSEEDEQRIRNGRLPRRSGDATQLVAPLNNDLAFAQPPPAEHEEPRKP
jgi:hypothetical protein